MCGSRHVPSNSCHARLASSCGAMAKPPGGGAAPVGARVLPATRTRTTMLSLCQIHCHSLTPDFCCKRIGQHAGARRPRPYGCSSVATLRQASAHRMEAQAAPRRGRSAVSVLLASRRRTMRHEIREPGVRSGARRRSDVDGRWRSRAGNAARQRHHPATRAMESHASAWGFVVGMKGR